MTQMSQGEGREQQKISVWKLSSHAECFQGTLYVVSVVSPHEAARKARSPVSLRILLVGDLRTICCVLGHRGKVRTALYPTDRNWRVTCSVLHRTPLLLARWKLVSRSRLAQGTF